jgi:hypothetical protein
MQSVTSALPFIGLCRCQHIKAINASTDDTEILSSNPAPLYYEHANRKLASAPNLTSQVSVFSRNFATFISQLYTEQPTLSQKFPLK